MCRNKRVFFTTLFFLVSFSLSSYSQAVGDFGSVGGGGNWGVTATWNTWFAGSFSVPAGAPPTTADNVWITAGNPVVVEATPKLCNNLTVQSGALLWTNNAAAGNLYVQVHGNIVCNGTIGNGATYDQISFDIAGANVTISGTGTFDAGRIYKNTSTNATSNLIIDRKVNLRSSGTQIYNALGIASYFNVTVNAGDSLILIGGSAAIDGTIGAGAAEQAGTFTINGYMDVQGILYLKTSNATLGYDCKWIVNGELRANEINAGASTGPFAKDSLLVNNGGILKITGVNAFSTVSTTFNTYNFLIGSTVEYSATGAQSIQHSLNFGGATLNQYYNLIISGVSGPKSPTGVLAVRNDLTISDTTGSPVLNATLFGINIGGNWKNYNQSGFTEGTLTAVSFIGGVAPLVANTQTITCPGGEIFNSLTINKGGASNTWFLRLNNDIIVAKILLFSNAPDRAALDLNGHKLSLTQPGVGSLIGVFDAANSRYIVSETAVGTPAYASNPSIIKWVTDTAKGAYVFPFGVNGSYIPLTIWKKATLTFDTLSVSTRGTGVDNRPWDTTTNVAYVNMMNSPYLVDSSNGSDSSAIDRWWDITVSPTNLRIDSMQFTYRGSENTLLTPYRTGRIFPQNWTGTSWSDKAQNTITVNNVGVTVGTGTVTMKSDTLHAAPWILVGFPIRLLPIDLLTFTAKLKDGIVRVDWATGSETNNHYFTVEKSRDGKSFEDVGKVDGAGNSSMTRYYNMVDHTPFTGLSYYRLRQTDFDGHFTFSEPVAVFNSDKNFSWYVFPNPATDHISIAKTTEDKNIHDALFQLFSPQGSLLKTITLNTKIQHVFTVDIKDYSSGIYIGKISDDSHQEEVFKIVKN